MNEFRDEIDLIPEIKRSAGHGDRISFGCSEWTVEEVEEIVTRLCLVVAEIRSEQR